jgi:HSP20 family protein
MMDSMFGETTLLANGNWMPEVDLTETEDEIVARVDLPGMDQKDIKVSMAGDMLVISGERKEEKEEKEKQHYSMERKHGMFERAMRINEAIEVNKIHAEYNKGVLEVHIPRKTGAKPHQIPVIAK